MFHVVEKIFRSVTLRQDQATFSRGDGGWWGTTLFMIHDEKCVNVFRLSVSNMSCIWAGVFVSIWGSFQLFGQVHLLPKFKLQTNIYSLVLCTSSKVLIILFTLRHSTHLLWTLWIAHKHRLDFACIAYILSPFNMVTTAHLSASFLPHSFIGLFIFFFTLQVNLLFTQHFGIVKLIIAVFC